MKKTVKIISIVSTLLAVMILGLIAYGTLTLPDKADTQNGSVKFGKIYSADFNGKTTVTASSPQNGQQTSESEIKLLSSIPVKTITITKKDRRYVIPGGELVGIKLRTKGVMIVNTESFTSDGKNVCPAKDAGIKVGDILIEANGKKILNNAMLTGVISDSNGAPISMLLSRDGKTFTATITPLISDATRLYKCGLWIRDCTSGIGTVTYADLTKGTIAALGHGIYDVDTNMLMTTDSGILMSAKLSGIAKGQSGKAGELQGYIGNVTYGDLRINCDQGVYGNLEFFNCDSESIPVAFTSETVTGKAQIICTAANNKKAYYDIEIEKVNYNSGDSKNMVIKITDEKLIGLTGGIVQGMSGSPIIQNGKLVGAVTHVFLNDPQRGYGIFAENMLSHSDEIAVLSDAA